MKKQRSSSAIDTEFDAYIESHTDDRLQADMMAETVILVDQNDLVTGVSSKLSAHQTPGRLHRAFSVLLFNSSGQLLIQQRSSDKITFPEYWANTCCSHPQFQKEELDPQGALGVKRAAIRKLEQELGISERSLQVNDLMLMTRLHYRADSSEHWIEEELDYILIAVADVELNVNSNEVAQTRWVSEEALSTLLNDQSGLVSIAPWFKIIATCFLPQWWPLLLDPAALKEACDDQIHGITHKCSGI